MISTRTSQILRERRDSVFSQKHDCALLVKADLLEAKVSQIKSSMKAQRRLEKLEGKVASALKEQEQFFKEARDDLIKL